MSSCQNENDFVSKFANRIAHVLVRQLRDKTFACRTNQNRGFLVDTIIIIFSTNLRLKFV